jgi:hypothetical protein
MPYGAIWRLPVWPEGTKQLNVVVFAIFRFIVIVISSFAVAGLVVFFLRMTGEKQSFSVPPHPLYDVKPFQVSWGGEGDAGITAFTLSAYQAAAADHMVLGAPLRVSRDGVWYVAGENELQKQTEGSGYLTFADSQDLDKVKYKDDDEGLLRFSKLVSEFPKENYFITVENPATPYIESIFKIIEGAKLEEHFIISTPFADTARLVRERNPKWFTGPTTSEIARAQFLSSLFLETLINLESEAFVADPPRLDSDYRLLRELRKRHILTLVKSDDLVMVHELLDRNLVAGFIK